ncbi:MAG: fasciclin domain-containing protein [Anaerolineae bacterium]
MKRFSIAFTILALMSLFVASVVSAQRNPQRPGDQTIAEIASGVPEYSILVDLLVQTGLVEVFQGRGQYTVFAPDNDAFAGFIGFLTETCGADTTNAILSDNEIVSEVLLYHVTTGRRGANSVVPAPGITMLNGDRAPSPGATIDGATIEAPNLASASNGIIHGIDAVIVPDGILELVGATCG